MTSRITFLVLTLFWLTMTYLLWRSEYIGHNQLGSAVPTELVWRKILTAPDNSSLDILHNGKKVGYCRWTANIGQDLAVGRILTDDAPEDTTAPPIASYKLNLEGNVLLNDNGSRLRFDTELRLTTNQAWQGLDIRLNMRPNVWEVHTITSEETVHFVTQDKSGRYERVFKYADLQNPQALLQDFDIPALGLLGMLSPFPHSQNATPAMPPLSLGLDWKARNDWIEIGHTSVRAYRLEAVVLERYRMRIIVSAVGEILRVDLPDGWQLVNDQLITL